MYDRRVDRESPNLQGSYRTVFELCVSLSVLWRKRSLKLNFYFMSFFSAVFSNRGPDGRSGEMKKSESRLSLKTVKDSLK